MDHKWVHSSGTAAPPPDAVNGGNDADGAPIFVGRAFHNGDMLVAKVIPTKQAAYVSWRGEEVPKDHFEVLCGQTLQWRQCHNHIIPENAVLCGKTALEQPVYIGRGHYEGSLTVGRISSVHRTLFIAFGGAERRVQSYEILVDTHGVTVAGWAVPPTEEDVKPSLELVAMPMPPPLYPPAPAETPYDPPPPYAVTSMPSLHYPPPPPPPAIKYPPPPMQYPTVVPPSLPPKFEYGSCTPATTYQPPHMPPPPIQPPYYPPPPPVQSEMWATADLSYMPPNAVHAGHDADLSTLYVCRAFHDGEQIPGKVIPNRGIAYISHHGQEHPKTNCEVLVGEPHLYSWVGACDGSVPPGAVAGGRTCNGETLYVGRAHFQGTLTPGKLQPSHHCLYIPFCGREERVQNYEVLVRKANYYSGQAAAMHY